MPALTLKKKDVFVNWAYMGEEKNGPYWLEVEHLPTKIKVIRGSVKSMTQAGIIAAICLERRVALGGLGLT